MCLQIDGFFSPPSHAIMFFTTHLFAACVLVSRAGSSTAGLGSSRHALIRALADSCKDCLDIGNGGFIVLPKKRLHSLKLT